MAIGIESELKLGLVSPDDLDLLLAALPAPKDVLLQRNFYYDTPNGRLSTARIMLRVREEGVRGAEPTAIAAAKRRKNRETARFVAEEIECVVPPALWLQIQAGTLDLATVDNEVLAWVRKEMGGLSTLSMLGVVANERTRVHVGAFLFEVDRTTFPDDSVDVEVEVETTDIEGARRAVEAVAKTAGVPLFDQLKGKHRRFRERLGH